MSNKAHKISSICPKCYATYYLGHEKYNADELELLYIIPCSCGINYGISSRDAIDTGIADTIAILNKKGYQTVFSCEGHAYERHFGYTAAYIMFTNKEDRQILEEYPLPKTWIDDTEHSYGAFTIRYNKRMKKNCYYLNDIKRWAISLPTKTEESSCFVYGYNGIIIL